VEEFTGRAKDFFHDEFSSRFQEINENAKLKILVGDRQGCLDNLHLNLLDIGFYAAYNHQRKEPAIVIGRSNGRNDQQEHSSATASRAPKSAGRAPKQSGGIRRPVGC